MQAMRLPEAKTFVQPSIRVVERIEKNEIQEAVELISSVDVSEVISDLTSSHNNLSTFSDGSLDVVKVNPVMSLTSMASIGVDEKPISEANSSTNSILSWLRNIQIAAREPVKTVKSDSVPHMPLSPEVVKAKIESIKSQSLSESVFNILTSYNQSAYPKQSFSPKQSMSQTASKSSTGVSSIRSSCADLDGPNSERPPATVSYNPQFEELLRKCSDSTWNMNYQKTTFSFE